MSVQKCKFCGCTEHRPCCLVEDPLGPCPLGTAVVPADAATRIIPCAWLIPDVCTNPACVDKAYLEARDLAWVVAKRWDEAVSEFLDDDVEIMS
jgi:hypothetical protein